MAARRFSLCPGKSSAVFLAGLFLSSVLFGAGDVLVGVPSECAACDSEFAWRYKTFGDGDACPADGGWVEPGFDDVAWSEGCLPIGYEQNLDICSGIEGQKWTIFARKRFAVSDPTVYESLTLNLLYDDGVVAYLNGVEVARSVVPGTVDPAACKEAASDFHEATEYESFTVSVDRLVPGENVLAVQVHNRRLGSSDLVLGAELLGNPPGPPRFTKGPYLQQPTATSVVVMWETQHPSSGRVFWGENAAEENEIEDPAAGTVHKVTISGLFPGRRFFYRVTAENDRGETESAVFSFRTAPDFAAAFRAVVYGDSREYVESHENVLNAIARSAPSVLFHIGDFVTNGRDYEEWGEQFFVPARELLSRVPFFPIFGNHDYEGEGPFWPYDLFSWPGVEDSVRWYASTYGCCRIVVLDGYVYESPSGPGSEQYGWLEREIDSLAYRQAAWRLVFVHYPPFHSAAGGQSDPSVIAVRENFLPLLEREPRADLLFSGHLHFYERSVIRNEAGDPLLTCITTGGGGTHLDAFWQNPYVPHSDRNPWGEVGRRVYEHVVLDVTPFSLRVRPAENDGTVFDPLLFVSAVPRLHEEKWRRAAGSVVSAIAVDAAGNVYVGGSTADSVPKARIARYSPCGSLLWARTYEHSGDLSSQAVFLTLDSSGAVYAVCSAVSGAGIKQWAVVGYDRGGAPLPGWPFRSPGAGEEIPAGAGVTSGGTVVVTSSVPGSGGTWGSVVTRAFSEGSVLWEDSYSTPGGESRSGGLAIAGDDTIYVAGESAGDGLLMAFDPAGGRLSAVTYDGGGEESFRGVVVSGETVFVSGTLENDGGLIKDVISGVYAASELENGPRWVTTWDGGGEEEVFALAAGGVPDTYVVGVESAADGGESTVRVLRFRDAGDSGVVISEGRIEGGAILPGGRSSALSCDGMGNVYVIGAFNREGATDILCAGFDANGEILWSERIPRGGADPAEGFCVDVGDYGTVFLGGRDGSEGILAAVGAAGSLRCETEGPLRQGSSFEVVVKGSLTEPALGFRFALSYDEKRLRFLSASLRETDWAGSGYFEVDDTEAGRVVIAAARDRGEPEGPVGFSGNVTFARLSFVAGSLLGTTRLEFACEPAAVFTVSTPPARERVFAARGLDLEIEPGEKANFVRGNVNASRIDPENPPHSVTLSDAVFLLQYLFADGGKPTCLEAADALDDGRLRLSDAIYILMWVFNEAGDLPEPFHAPGSDEDGDGLNCEETQIQGSQIQGR